MNVSCLISIKELEQSKLSSSTKSATVDKVITRKHKEAESKTEFIVTKYKLLNTWYPASTSHILEKFSHFYCKIEIFVAFHRYFAFNITLVLRFMMRNKFYYVQTANVNSKNASC